MRSFTQRALWLGLVVALFVVALCLAVAPTLSLAPLYTRQERFGIGFVTKMDSPGGVVTQSLSEYDVTPLKVGWYSDWAFGASPDMPIGSTLEYVQLIRVGDANWPPNWAAVQNAVVLNQGSTWLIGNEPECPNQDAVNPATYAERYHDVFTWIRGWDPTAQIAIGGIVEPTPLRFLWLERAMAAYEQQYGEPMPVDIWNIHVQILPEGAETAEGYDSEAGAGIPVGIDPVAEGIEPRHYTLLDCANVGIFENMVWDFCEWMADQGERDKPLIISEMGVLQPSFYLVEGGSEAERQERGDQLIEQFMVDAFDFLLNETDAAVGCPDDENRLVQRWLWFSLNGSFWDESSNPSGFNGSLYDYQTKKPTRFGQRFIAYQSTDRVYIPFVCQ